MDRRNACRGFPFFFHSMANPSFAADFAPDAIAVRLVLFRLHTVQHPFIIFPTVGCRSFGNAHQHGSRLFILPGSAGQVRRDCMFGSRVIHIPEFMALFHHALAFLRLEESEPCPKHESHGETGRSVACSPCPILFCEVVFRPMGVWGFVERAWVPTSCNLVGFFPEERVAYPSVNDLWILG